jgi:diadenylate cyclase
MNKEYALIYLFDAVLLGFLLWFLYKLLRGSVAFTITIGLLIVIAAFAIVRYINAPLSLNGASETTLGVIIIILVLFQQELRRFLMVLGRNVLAGNRYSISRLLPLSLMYKEKELHMMEAIIEACERLSSQQTGAIIVFTGTTELKSISQSGTNIDALVSARIIESIFNKQSPLHDGAVIINNSRIKAAGCVLPLTTEIGTLPGNVGLRHRAAVSITYQSDAVAIIVSEENGNISIAKQGQLIYNLSQEELLKELVHGG